MGVTASSGGGDFWKPPNGMYVVELLDVEDRPQQQGYGGKLTNQWRATFRLLNLADQTPYVGPDADGKAQEGTDGAEINVDLTQSLHPKSTARPWFGALLDREIEDGDSSDDIIPECIGKRAMAQFTNNENRKPGKLKNLIPLPPTADQAE